MTLEELKEYIINHYDPDDVLELLDITTEELVEQFDYKIEDNYDKLMKEVDEQD